MAVTNLQTLKLVGRVLQCGNGIPDHSSVENARYYNLDNNIEYINTAVGSNWIQDSEWSNIGIIDSALPSFTDNNNGTLTINSCIALLKSDTLFVNKSKSYIIAQATLSLTDNIMQYIAIKYNSGTPIYYVENDITNINNSNNFLVYKVWRIGTYIHSMPLGLSGTSLADRINLMLLDTQPYNIASGNALTPSETTSPNPRTIIITSARVYTGSNLINVLAYNSSASDAFLTKAIHTAGGWTYNSSSKVYQNTSYNPDSTGETTIPNNKWIFMHLYRSIGDTKEVFYVESTTYYGSIDEARAASSAERDDLPDIIKYHSLLVGRILIQYNASSGTTEPFIRTDGFYVNTVPEHNSTLNKQGGVLANNEYYHQSSTANTFTEALASTGVNDLQITQITSDSWLSNTAKSVYDYLNKSWNYLKAWMSYRGDNGIPDSEKSKWSATYNASTRVLTITISSNSVYYLAGRLYTINAGSYNTTAHTNTTGVYYVYFNSSNVLTVSNITWSIFNDVPLYAIIYNSNNAGAGAAGIILYELHGMSMSPATHYYLHKYNGAVFISGGAVTGETIQTQTVAAVSWGMSACVFMDEDIELTSDIQGESNYLCGYFDASNNFNWSVQASVPFFIGGDNNIQYNQIGTGLTSITNNGTYVNYYTVLINANTSSQRVLTMPGQATYSSLALAQAETPASLNLSYLPFTEFIFIKQRTYRREGGYSTVTGRSRLEANPISLNVNKATLTGAAGNHSLLSNRTDANSHPTTAISRTASGNLVGTDSEVALMELQGDIDKMYWPIQFSLMEEVNNNAVYFYSFLQANASTTGIRSGSTSNGLQNQYNCSPIICPFTGYIKAANFQVKGAAVANGSVTYPVKLSTALYNVGWTTEGTNMATISLSLPNSGTPVGTYSVADTNANINVTGLNIAVTLGDKLALKYTPLTGASGVNIIRNVIVTLLIVPAY